MYIILQIGSGSYIYIIYIDCGCLNISIYIKKKMNITISGINISSYMKNAWLTFYDASLSVTRYFYDGHGFIVVIVLNCWSFVIPLLIKSIKITVWI